MNKFAVWVAPEKRDEAGIKGDKFWVVNKESSSYVTEEHRGIWNTREEALGAIVEGWEDLEEVIEIEEALPSQGSAFDKYVDSIDDAEKEKIIEAFDTTEQAIQADGMRHVSAFMAGIGMSYDQAYMTERMAHLERLANACYRHFWLATVADNLWDSE